MKNKTGKSWRVFFCRTNTRHCIASRKLSDPAVIRVGVAEQRGLAMLVSSSRDCVWCACVLSDKTILKNGKFSGHSK